MENVVLFGLVTLFVTMGVRVSNPGHLVAEIFYHTATTRPPMLLVATVMGWAGVMRCAEGLPVSKAIGSTLKPAVTLRGAVVLLDGILICRLFPILWNFFFQDAAEHHDAWATLVGDIGAYVCCLVALMVPPSRFFSSAAAFDAQRSSAHAKYGHGLASETSHARASLTAALWETLLAPFAPVTFWHVIVADYATSLAKGLGDAHVTTCVAAQAFLSA